MVNNIRERKNCLYVKYTLRTPSPNNIGTVNTRKIKDVSNRKTYDLNAPAIW